MDIKRFWEEVRMDVYYCQQTCDHVDPIRFNMITSLLADL